MVAIVCHIYEELQKPCKHTIIGSPIIDRSIRFSLLMDAWFENCGGLISLYAVFPSGRSISESAWNSSSGAIYCNWLTSISRFLQHGKHTALVQLEVLMSDFWLAISRRLSKDRISNIKGAFDAYILHKLMRSSNFKNSFTLFRMDLISSLHRKLQEVTEECDAANEEYQNCLNQVFLTLCKYNISLKSFHLLLPTTTTGR